MILKDNFGGSVIIFQNNNILYAQRKTVGGQLNWGDESNPMVVYSGTGSISVLDLISDKQDGFYILFSETINENSCNLYLNHIGANGQSGNNILVNPANLPYCTDGKLCLSQQDVFVVWSTNKYGNGPYQNLNSNIYFQKFSDQGIILLDSNAVEISTQAGNRFSPVVSSDLSGGMYIAFTDTRNSFIDGFGYIQNYDVYAQHVNANGSKLWPVTDLVINNTVASNQITYQDFSPPFSKKRKSSITTSDGNWYIFYGNDETSLNVFDNLVLEVKKISFSGTELWSNPVKVTPGQTTKNYLQIEPDNSNGVVLHWRNTSPDAEVYVQRIANDGQLPWGLDGIKIPPAGDQDLNMTGSHMAKTDEGNYVIVWKMDTVKTDQSGEAYYIKAQKINDNGDKLWNNAGVYICNNENISARYPSLNSSIDSSVIVSWVDSRGINAARLLKNGSLKNITDISYTTIASGNWSDPSVWAGGMVPEPGADVTISMSIIINIPVVCNSITLLAPAIVTALPGISVTVFN